MLEEFESFAAASKAANISTRMLVDVCNGVYKFATDKTDGIRYGWKRKNRLVRLKTPKDAVQFRNYTVLALKNGEIWSTNKNNLMKQGTNHDGYKIVSLFEKGKKSTFLVHRIIAEVFIENPLGLKIVHHIDGNRKNNDVSNLRWVTASENASESFISGANAKRKRKVWAYDRKTLKFIMEFESVTEAGKFAGVRPGSISNILNGLTGSRFKYIWKNEGEKPQKYETDVRLIYATSEFETKRFTTMPKAFDFAKKLSHISRLKFNETCKNEEEHAGYIWYFTSGTKVTFR